MSNQTSAPFLICTRPEDWLYDEHVCFFTDGGYEGISVKEIVRSFYRHPEAPDHAKIDQYEIRNVQSYRRLDVDSGPAVVLEAAQNSVKEQLRRKAARY